MTASSLQAALRAGAAGLYALEAGPDCSLLTEPGRAATTSGTSSTLVTASPAPAPTCQHRLGSRDHRARHRRIPQLQRRKKNAPPRRQPRRGHPRPARRRRHRHRRPQRQPPGQSGPPRIRETTVPPITAAMAGPAFAMPASYVDLKSRRAEFGASAGIFPALAGAVSAGQDADLDQVVGQDPVPGPGPGSFGAVQAGAVPSVLAFECADPAFASGSPLDGPPERGPAFGGLAGLAGPALARDDDVADPECARRSSSMAFSL